MTYEVELNYNAQIVVVVEADNEGEAMGKAREIAEEADMDEFVLTTENDCIIR